MMTISTGYNTRLLKMDDHYQFFYMKKEFHEIGKMRVLSPYGNTIAVYDEERTICDCLKKKDKLDIDLVLMAVRQYMRDPDKKPGIFVELKIKMLMFTMKNRDGLLRVKSINFIIELKS